MQGSIYDRNMWDDLLRRLGRTPYYPQWGDAKHRQSIASASVFQLGEDRTEEILCEIRNRQQRTGSPGRPGQPWADAELKVWRRFARATGNRQLSADLEERVRDLRRR